MRIISEFRDYYDSISSYDQSGRVWLRKTDSFELPYYNKSTFIIRDSVSFKNSKKNPFTLPQMEYICEIFDERPKVERASNINVRGESYIIGLCGKVYYVLSVRDSFRVLGIFTDFDECTVVHPDIKRSSYSLPVDDWNIAYHDNKKTYDLFISLKSPLFMIGYDYNNYPVTNRAHFIVNPFIKPLNIPSLFDPWFIYQEIDMFLNNDLTNVENGNIVRTDELIRDSKGFDIYSFRQVGCKERKIKKK